MTWFTEYVENTDIQPSSHNQETKSAILQV